MHKNRNQRCPCGSGKKRKACEDFHEVLGPVESEELLQERAREAERERQRAREKLGWVLGAAAIIDPGMF